MSNASQKGNNISTSEREIERRHGGYYEVRWSGRMWKLRATEKLQFLFAIKFCCHHSSSIPVSVFLSLSLMPSMCFARSMIKNSNFHFFLVNFYAQKKVKPAEMTIWLQCHAECQGAAFISLFTQCAYGVEKLFDNLQEFLKEFFLSINYCKEFWEFAAGSRDDKCQWRHTILIQLMHFNDNFLIAT